MIQENFQDVFRNTNKQFVLNCRKTINFKNATLYRVWPRCDGQMVMDLYKLCMSDKILEYFQAGLSYMGSNKYSGGYGPKGMYVNRNRGLSLDRLQGNGYSNGNSLQTSPTRRPSYGLTRTRSQAHLLAHSSGEDSYGSSSRPPSTYDTYR